MWAFTGLARCVPQLAARATAAAVATARQRRKIRSLEESKMQAAGARATALATLILSRDEAKPPASLRAGDGREFLGSSRLFSVSKIIKEVQKRVSIKRKRGHVTRVGHTSLSNARVWSGERSSSQSKCGTQGEPSSSTFACNENDLASILLSAHDDTRGGRAADV